MIPAMRGYARGMLNAMTVLSLLLCVATAMLWASSYVRDGSIRSGTLRQCVIRSTRGRITLSVWRVMESFRGQVRLVAQHAYLLYEPTDFDGAAAGEYWPLKADS